MISIATLDPSEHRLYDLHIGIDPERIAEFAESYIGWPDPDGQGWMPAVLFDTDLGGTSWEQWGEDPWDGDDGTPDAPGPELGEHVVIRCGSVVSAFMCLAAVRESGFDLVPMRFVSQRGTVASITTAHDWSEEYLSVKAGRRYGDLITEGAEHLAPEFHQ